MGILGSFSIERVFCGSYFVTPGWWASSDSPPVRSRVAPEDPSESSLLTHYALREKDLIGLLREAWTHEPARLLENFVSLLERRLDNIVFRMGFAESIPEARRLISRGHILVNRYPPKDASIRLWPGDVVHFALKPYDQYSISHHFQPRPLPSYLQYLNPRTTDRGMMLSLPTLGDSPIEPFRSTSNCHCRRAMAH